MTNEETIKNLKKLKSFHNGSYGTAIDMAIKALEQQQNVHDTCKKCIEFSEFKQQPCEDCISREETLKAFAEKCGGECGCCKYNGSGYDTAENCKLIKSMPSVTPKTGWISVSERLPKENEYIGDVCKYYLIQDEYGDMHVAHLSNGGWIPMHSLKAIGDEVIAWMPLPTPYEEVQDE